MTPVASFVRLFLLLFALVIGAVIALIGFDAIHATDAKLLGWTGLGLAALAGAALIRD